MALRIRDQRKLIEAGYELFRLELHEKRIKMISRPGCWSSYKKYRTQKECQEAWDFLMSNDKTISG